MATNLKIMIILNQRYLIAISNRKKNIIITITITKSNSNYNIFISENNSNSNNNKILELLCITELNFIFIESSFLDLQKK